MEFVSLALLSRAILVIAHLLSLFPQAVWIVVRVRWLVTWGILVYVYNSHFLIQTLFCVFLCVLFLLVTLVLLSYWAVSLGTKAKGLYPLLRPGLQPTYLWVIHCEGCIIGSIDEGYAWYWPFFRKRQEIRPWLLRLISYEGDIQLIILIIYVLFIHTIISSSEVIYIKDKLSN